MTRLCRLVAVSFATLLFGAGCTGVFYQPDRVLYSSPEKSGFPRVRQLALKARDGTKLVAWFFPAAAAATAKGAPKGTIVQFHGNAENMSSHYLSLAWLTLRGYNLVTFDYRGYGGSEGEPSPEGTVLDGLAALDLAWELRTGPRFIVFGQSLGGAIAMRAFDQFEHRGETQLVVLDSTFCDYHVVARRTLAAHWFTWPISPLSYLLVSNSAGCDEAVARNRTRLLVLHDRRDPTVSFANGEDIVAIARRSGLAPVDFWILDQGHHIAAMSPFNTEYREKFVELLDSLN